MYRLIVQLSEERKGAGYHGYRKSRRRNLSVAPAAYISCVVTAVFLKVPTRKTFMLVLSHAKLNAYVGAYNSRGGSGVRWRHVGGQTERERSQIAG